MSRHNNIFMNSNNKKISAVVLVKNEEKNITSCLESIKWCNEIIIVDDNSKDDTAHLIKRYGAKVIKHVLNNDFSTQRNIGLQQANNDWVLFIDADEVIHNALAFEIKNVISQSINNYNGFYIKRRDILWGRELRYGEVGSTKLLRLAKKNKGNWVGKVHEVWIIEGSVGELQNYIMHYPHQSISEFLQEINLYTDIRSKELFEMNSKFITISIIVYPLTKFLLNYIVRLGFMDGVPGLLVAILMSFHSFLVRGKHWMLWKEKK